jgi:phage baseplate assembly protein W
MPNLLTRFQKTVVGSNKKIGDYLSKIDVSGDFKRVTDIEVIIASWSNILVTPKRTYQFDPEYGSDLYKMVFEPSDDTTIDAITDEVVGALSLYDDRAIIKDINVNFLSNMKGFNIAIDVEYEGAKGELEVVIDENAYFKFLEVADLEPTT